MDEMQKAVLTVLNNDYRVGDVFQMHEIGPKVKAVRAETNPQTLYDALGNLIQPGFLAQEGEWSFRYIKEAQAPVEKPAPKKRKEVLDREQVVALLMEGRTTSDPRQIARIQIRLKDAFCGGERFDDEFMQWRKEGWYGGAYAFADYIMKKGK